MRWVGRREEGGGDGRTPPGIIEKSRVSRREMWGPGPSVIGSPIFPQRDASIGRTQSSRLIKQHANSANSYILKRACR